METSRSSDPPLGRGEDCGRFIAGPSRSRDMPATPCQAKAWLVISCRPAVRPDATNGCMLHARIDITF
jgi:hypothetical protein